MENISKDKIDDLDPANLPARFAQLKRDIAASSGADFEANAIRSWAEIIEELAKRTKEIAAQGSNYIPQVDFTDLDGLSPEQIKSIKTKGCVVVRNIVNDEQAMKWRTELLQFVDANPNAPGWPKEEKQLFEIYWAKPQVEARAHPNMLATCKKLNQMYQAKSSNTEKVPKEVDLSTPLTYADRWRNRKTGTVWGFLPPHVDGGSMERWEDPTFRQCFDDIFQGKWREHDPYDLTNRIAAQTSKYGRANQSSVFRAYQGWLAMSETAPGEGTLKVFPDVKLSNAYLMLRPFFQPPETRNPDDIRDASKWTFNLESPNFPGITRLEKGYVGPMPTDELHPHLDLRNTMTSVPKVYPGDAVFWHCDVVHAVEENHNGKNDSCVMYIPSVPYTTYNAAYVQRQKECFLQGLTPPDFPKYPDIEYKGNASETDILSREGRAAMGFNVEVA